MCYFLNVRIFSLYFILFIFRDILDQHSGLTPGSMLRFTPDSAGENLWGSGDEISASHLQDKYIMHCNIYLGPSYFPNIIYFYLQDIVDLKRQWI